MTAGVSLFGDVLGADGLTEPVLTEVALSDEPDAGGSGTPSVGAPKDDAGLTAAVEDEDGRWVGFLRRWVNIGDGAVGVAWTSGVELSGRGVITKPPVV